MELYTKRCKRNEEQISIKRGICWLVVGIYAIAIRWGACSGELFGNVTVKTPTSADCRAIESIAPERLRGGGRKWEEEES